MTNRRFQRAMAQMGRKEFLEIVGAAQKTRPEGMKIPAVAMIDPAKWKNARDLPFTPGDRVQIVRGEHKNKVGQILYKYPFGNAFAVNGIAPEKVVNSIETKLQVGDDEHEPVSEMPRVFDYKDLRLVSTIKGEAGDKDVAIHSISLGPEKYDPVSNTHKRVRYATHAPWISVPWPMVRAEPVAEEKAQLTTNPTVADTRTHYVTSAVEPPLPMAAIPQVTNLNNKFRRARYAPRITAADIAKYSAPQMPVPPKTRALLEEIKKLPNHDWSKGEDYAKLVLEMQEFVGAEVQKGVKTRAENEKNALQQYT